MSPDRSPHRSRRTVLSVLATVGSLGLSGCLGDEQTENERNTSNETPPTNETKPSDEQDTDDEKENTGDEKQNEEDESEEQPVEDHSWDEIDPTGETRYTDDPNWRMLGHDTGNTFTNPHAEGPSDDPSVRWTLGGETNALFDKYGTHHPLIVDGTVYTTIEAEATRDSEEKSRWKFLAIDSETGQTETVFEANARIWHPIIIDETVYCSVLDPVSSVRAYDLKTGQEQWKQYIRTSSGMSAIRKFREVIIVTRKSDSLFNLNKRPHQWALDADTGKILWKKEKQNVVNMPRLAMMADGAVCLPSMHQARDLESGDSLANLPNLTSYTVLHDGVVYGVTDNEEKTAITSYDWTTLDERWTYRPADDKTLTAGWPIVVDDTVVASLGRQGFVGIHRETGERRWQIERPWDEYLPSMFHLASSNTVYIVHDGGAATALDPTDGSIQWQLQTDEMGWSPVRGCALADDLLVTVSYGGTIHAIS